MIKLILQKEHKEEFMVEENCIFCKIIKKEIPAKVVYEDKDIIAFDDINKNAPVHILVIPKQHIDSILEINEHNQKIIGDIHLAINKIAREQGFDKDGFRVISNCGKNAGQTVKHIHYHILGGKPLGERLI